MRAASEFQSIDKSFLPSYHKPLLARRSEPYVAKEATTPELAMADRCFASLNFTIRNSHFVFPEVNFSTVSPYPLALNIISDCWILFCRYLASRGVLDQAIGLSRKQMATVGLLDPDPGRRLLGFQRPSAFRSAQSSRDSAC